MSEDMSEKQYIVFLDRLIEENAVESHGPHALLAILYIAAVSKGEEIPVSNQTLRALTGIKSTNGFQSLRNNLKKSPYIQVKSGPGRSAPIYKIVF